MMYSTPLDQESLELLNKNLRVDLSTSGPGFAKSLSDILDINVDLPSIIETSAALAAGFREQDVEPLLDQALSILDQALADRIQFDLIGEKYATLALDLL